VVYVQRFKGRRKKTRTFWGWVYEGDMIEKRVGREREAGKMGYFEKGWMQINWEGRGTGVGTKPRGGKGKVFVTSTPTASPHTTTDPLGGTQYELQSGRERTPQNKTRQGWGNNRWEEKKELAQKKTGDDIKKEVLHPMRGGMWLR